MKTEYKYIKFDCLEEKAKTQVWCCSNKRSNFLLGLVMWYAAWRQYIFIPNTRIEAVFSADCLNDIADFIGQLMKERRKPKP